ncbi:MAG: hypothetical protein WC340_17930 [Kiritimatiellia bacterium]
MRGYPKHMNTRHDLDVAMQIDATRTRVEVQRMLDAKDVWTVGEKLPLTDAGVIDATHKVVEVEDEAGTVVETYQYELKEDPAARLFQVGLTVTEAQDIVGGE